MRDDVVDYRLTSFHINNKGKFDINKNIYIYIYWIYIWTQLTINNILKTNIRILGRTFYISHSIELIQQKWDYSGETYKKIPFVWINKIKKKNFCLVWFGLNAETT